jgi:protocatechuate 3,4-dioxygenase beta subunit
VVPHGAGTPLGMTDPRAVSVFDADLVDRLASRAPACRLLPEQTEGPYHRDVHPERRDITEGRPGLALRVGLRFVDPDGNPLEGHLVDVWHADHEGRYSGFRPFEPEPGQEITEDTVPRDVTAPRESFLRGAQRSDHRGMCAFDTIYPGWYAGRTVHIHLIARLDERSVTTQLYFPDPVSDAVHARPPYRDRGGRRDTTNATDTIFAGVGDRTILELDGDPDTGFTGVLCLTVGGS